MKVKNRSELLSFLNQNKISFQIFFDKYSRFGTKETKTEKIDMILIKIDEFEVCFELDIEVITTVYLSENNSISVVNNKNLEQFLENILNLHKSIQYIKNKKFKNEKCLN